MVSIFVLLNIDILISHVKKDLKGNYKLYCEYDIKKHFQTLALKTGQPAEFDD